MTTSVTNEHTSLKKYKSLTLYSRKGDIYFVWEMSWRQGQTTILNQVLPLDHSSTSFSSCLGLLNRGSQRTQSTLSAAGSHFGILSPTDSNRLGTWLYYWLKHTPASTVHPLITQGHLLIDGSVEGQYITLEMIIKLCCNFRSCILVILPNNPRKSPTFPIKQLSLSSRVLLQWGGFWFLGLVSLFNGISTFVGYL